MDDQRPDNERQEVVGIGDDPQHRAPVGEGVRAPLAEKPGDIPQTSVFDGKGNEDVVALSENKEGRRFEGTGDTLDDALDEAATSKDAIGKGFQP